MGSLGYRVFLPEFPMGKSYTVHSHANNSGQGIRMRIYEDIGGRSINAEEVTTADIDSAVQFLTKLKELKCVKGSELLMPASEACFSVRAIISNIEQRLKRLTLVEKKEIIIACFLISFQMSFYRVLIQ